MRRIVEDEQGNYSFIDDGEGSAITVEIQGTEDVAEVVDDKTWESLVKTRHKHATVKKMINENTHDHIRSIRRRD